jgi:hypothetical protein
MRVPYTVVVEKDDVRAYAHTMDIARIKVVPQKCHDEYDNCDELGQAKSQGPGPARNFAWDDSLKRGFPWHWVMDDNIFGFHRNTRGRYLRCTDGTCLQAMEDFALRYRNVAMAGPNYFMFIHREGKIPPVVVNTRIYSCNLIRNDAPFRWRGRYNEDTDLSLRMLKAGWCTVQFNAFDQLEAPTQTVPGGNTGEFYSQEGTLAKSLMQVRLHPDVSRLVWKFGRWHHRVDYSQFRRNRLALRPGLSVPAGSNDYGMRDATAKTR